MDPKSTKPRENEESKFFSAAVVTSVNITSSEKDIKNQEESHNKEKQIQSFDNCPMVHSNNVPANEEIKNESIVKKDDKIATPIRNIENKITESNNKSAAIIGSPSIAAIEHINESKKSVKIKDSDAKSKREVPIFNITMVILLMNTLWGIAKCFL